MPVQFRDLTEQQLLALAISAEEEDGHTYADYANAFRTSHPATAELFSAMAAEESRHRHRLIDVYRAKFGEHIPLVRRGDVTGFHLPKGSLLGLQIQPNRARARAAEMELQARNFYQQAAGRVTDAAVRQLLGDLAAEEGRHESLAVQINERHEQDGTIASEHDSARRSFVLRIVQPGLAGLMDGSVSTLAPLFAAAFATGSTFDTLRVGFAASVGAGISMGFAEALSDDGKISGRGKPFTRGLVCGLMTTVGGIGHTLPYLLPDFRTATAIAIVVVLVELAVISWIRWRYMETSPLAATLQVAVGGALVFVAGWLIGSS